MKAIVLGLDGAELDLILPAVERGELPGFARLMREGAWGRLRSTVPPDSPSAWTSFATGVNPGRHGVFGFMARRPGSYDYDIGSSLHVRAPTLWEIASQRGVRVGVINVPITYPPRPVNGILAAGMPAPDLRSSFVYPVELRSELLRAVPSYSIGHGLGRTRRSDPRAVLARSFSSAISAREQAMWWLAEKCSADLLICVFTVLDRLQHFLWADMDDHHPAHSPSHPHEWREAIVAAYRQFDSIIARALAGAGDDSLVVVLSDHGFEPVARTFYVNSWLAKRGLLATRASHDEPSGWTTRVAPLLRHALALMPGTEGLRERLRARHLISRAFVNAIDWQQTRAWFGLDRGLWLNVEGRDPFGMVGPGREYEQLRSELMAELESLTDPENGYRVVRKVHRREDVYNGPELARLPDLVVEPARHPTDPRGRYVLSERIADAGSGSSVGPGDPISGYHTSDGVILIRGPHIQGGTVFSQAHIYDVAPTILHFLGIGGAEQMEGKPLLAASERSGQAAASESVARTAQPAPLACGDVPLTEKERQAVEQQLKTLGYID